MSNSEKAKTVIVVGAGLGGISAALSLALEGYSVKIFEKNSHIGGKLNDLSAEGYKFDLGPSILTLPHIFRRTFEKAGKEMGDYVDIRPVRPHWRNFFEDGSVIDLYPEPEKMAEQARQAGEPAENVEHFLDYAGGLYDLVNKGYFEEGLDSFMDFCRFYSLADFARFDLFRSMHQSTASHFETAHFVDIFDFFIKYVGSSAYKAPAFMHCLPTIQFRHDLWYVMGGLHGLADGLEKLMRELQVEIALDTEVSEILLSPDGKTAQGVKLDDGTEISSAYVVSNMEVISAGRTLLNEDAKYIQKLEKRFEPTCSGLVIDIGLDRQYADVQHHNFFFSKNQKQHFEDVYNRKTMPHDPTLYVVAASRTDPSVAPEGCDCIKVLPHIPHLLPSNPVGDEEYIALKERIYDKLERVAMPGLRDHIVFEHFWTPRDIQEMYFSNRGSIYGVVADRFKNFAFKAPKKSKRFNNLYFVGGSVNPGGGMPMVFLSGQNTAKMIVDADRRAP